MKKERLLELAGVLTEAKYQSPYVPVMYGSNIVYLTHAQKKEIERIAMQVQEVWDGDDDALIEQLLDKISELFNNAKKDARPEYVWDWTTRSFNDPNDY